MALNSNQFAMQPVAGDEDLGGKGGLAISCQVSASQATALVPGQAVKFEDSAGGVPKVLSCADTDAADGFVLRNMKDIEYTAGEKLEIAMVGKFMWMTAAAAIARNAKLEVVNASVKVKTAVGVNPIVGVAFDKAAADGDLIRVRILDTKEMQPLSILGYPIAADGAVTTGQVLKFDTNHWENGTDLDVS